MKISWILKERHILPTYHYLLYFSKELNLYKQEEYSRSEFDNLNIPGLAFPKDLIYQVYFYENIIGAAEFKSIKEAVQAECGVN